MKEVMGLKISRMVLPAGKPGHSGLGKININEKRNREAWHLQTVV